MTEDWQEHQIRHAWEVAKRHDLRTDDIPLLLAEQLKATLRTERRIQQMQESQADFDVQLNNFFTAFTTYAQAVSAFIAAIPAPVQANLATEGAQVTAALTTLNAAMAALPVPTPPPVPPPPAPTP